MTDSKSKKPDEQRQTLRLNFKDGEEPILILNGVQQKILDLSENSVKFEVNDEILDIKGEIKFSDDKSYDSSGKILRVKNQELVLCFSEELSELISKKILEDSKKFSDDRDKSADEKRKKIRLKYPTDMKTTICIANQTYDILDISEVATRISVESNKDVLTRQGNVVFPDNSKYYTEGRIVRLEGNKAIFLFSNNGIPTTRIAKEVLKSLDDYWDVGLKRMA